MGTKANSADEWVELKNATNAEIDLAGWGLYEAGGSTLVIALTKKISANGYYLIERTDDTVIADVPADETGSFGGSGLNNSGEHVVLKDNAGNVVDNIDFSSGWPAGSASPDYASMEKDAQGWHTNDGTAQNGMDVKGNPIHGTPRAPNSGAGVSPSSSSQTTAQPSGASAASQNTIVADAGANIVAVAGDAVSFDASRSTGAGLLAFSWNFGDGNVAEGKTTMHRYQFPGKYVAVLTVSDGSHSSQDQIEATIYAQSVVISEFLPSSESGGQWLELYNTSDSFADLSGWSIGIGGSAAMFRVPEHTFIAGGGFLVFSGDTLKITFPLSGHVVLSYPTGQTAHEVTYENAKMGWSVARADDGNPRTQRAEQSSYDERFVWTQSPTPGGTNMFLSAQEPAGGISSSPVSAIEIKKPTVAPAPQFQDVVAPAEAKSEGSETTVASTAKEARDEKQAPVALAAHAFPWNTYLFILGIIGIFFVGLRYIKRTV
ncbi:lamin tail domain-containing protein [Candidatus Azambacteria bacterium]|nr:lamin tail domain-containing protein [Candidatus Azambacteria bacterium]